MYFSLNSRKLNTRFLALGLTCALGAWGGGSTATPPTVLGGAIGGTFTAYAIPPLGANGVILSQFITSGPDGALWFTELGGNAIGRITTAGQISQYPLPTSAASP